MANFWVSKSGNDATGDGSPANPYLTITKAVTGAANSDTVYITTGIYKEQVNWGARTTPTAITIEASGMVIIDAENTRTSCVTLSTGANSFHTFRKLIFKNATAQLVGAGGLTGARPVFYDCEFLDGPVVYSSGQSEFYNCIFRNINSQTLGAITWTTGNPGVIQDCLWDNITTLSGCIVSTASATPTIFRTIFSNIRRAGNGLPNWVYLQLSGASAVPTAMNYNWFDHGCKWRQIATEYDDLAEWQARGSNLDGQSMSGTPEFVDKVKGMFAPLPGGNLLGIQPNGGYIGPFRVAYGLSSGRNASQWNAPSLVNIEQNSSGNYIITNGALLSGTITFPTQDLGAVVRLRAIRLSTFGETALDVADVDVTDVPNHWTVEYRTSSIGLADCEAQSFVKARRVAAGLINLPSGLNARWFQIRVVLRNNGVEA